MVEEFPFTLEDVEAELAERSLHEFVKASWHVLHQTEPFIDGWHIGAMCEHLEALVRGEIKKLLINIAIKMTKSMVASVCLPAWAWIDWPSASFIYCSYSDDLASEHSVYSRRLVESRWYRRHWGNRFRLTSDQNEKMHFENDQGGSRAAYGMTGVTGHGALFNCVDDPHDRKDWQHPNKIKANVDAYESNIYPAVNDPIHARRLVIAQRVSPTDLSGHLLRQGGWETLIIPTEFDPKRARVTVIGWKDPRVRAGELACPNRWGSTEVGIAKKNPRLFASHHQQAPSADEGKLFKREHWRYYREDPRNVLTVWQKNAEQVGRKLPPPVLIQSWDCAFKDLHESSLVAGHVWAKLGADMLLLDREGSHLDFNRTVQAIVRMSEKWPGARAKLVEGKANGPAVKNFLQGRIAGIIEWPPKGVGMDSKEARAAVMQPDHEGGNIWLPDPQAFPWVNEVVEYFADFPDGEFDDDIDAASQAYAYFERTMQIGWRPI